MASLGDRVLAHLRGIAGADDPEARSEDTTEVGFAPTLAAIADRFDVGERLGEGGMGTVYRAWDRVTGRAVALKILRHGEQALEQRFDREIRALAALDHPGIVGYVAHGGPGSGDPPFVAMDLLDGEDLAARIARGPLQVRETIHLGAQLAGALAAAHAVGLVHRDVKPTNVILCRDGTARLVDFGLARLIEDEAPLTHEGYAAGTPGYMAPEQARGEPDVDARADVFALGCVLHDCLCGAPPPGRDASSRLAERAPLRRLRPDAPEALEAILLEMMSPRRGARLADGCAVAARLGALEPFADLDPLGARPSSTPAARPGGDGRRGELELARARLEERLATNEFGCLVVGPPGAGKTSLALDLVGPDWIVVSADPVRADEPLGFLSRVVAAASGVSAADGADDRRRRIEAKVREATQDAGVVAALAGLASRAGRVPEAASAFLRWTEGAWAQKAWSLVLDDLDAADPESVAVLAEAFARPGVARPRVLALARPAIATLHAGAAARLGLAAMSLGGPPQPEIEGRIASRLAELGAYARWALAAASLFPGPFSEAALTDVLGQRDPRATRGALLELALFGWIAPIRATPAAYRIRSRLASEIARSLLCPSELALGRRRADALCDRAV